MRRGRPVRRLRTAIAWGSYPVLLSASVLLTPWLLSLGEGRLHETLVVSGVLAVATAVVMVFEVVHPRVAFRPDRNVLAVDVLHAVLSAICGATLARMLFFGAIAWASATAARYGWGIWPDTWPLWLQLAPAVLISDLAIYVFHRTSHAVPFLWRLHEIHHSSEGLYTLASGRAHPIYVAFSTAITTAPLLVLGADPPTLAMLSAFVGVNGLLQHSNVALHCRSWRLVLATADLHRWHHGTGASQGRNFGNTLSVWDRLFGTWHPPEGAPDALGLQGSPVALGYVSHLVRPFRRRG